MSEEGTGKRVCVLRMAFLPYLLPPIRQFLEDLADRGHAVTLVKSYMRDRSRQEEERPKLRNIMLGLWMRRLPKSKLFEPLVFLEFVVRCVVQGLLVRPHLVVAVDVDTLLQGYVIARLCRAKLLYYSVELYTERPGFEPKWLWLWLERRLINKADLVVACEPNRARVMQEKYGARALPMTVLNVPRYAEPERTTKIQDYLAAQGVVGKKVAFYVGELKRARCIDEFIKAARLLHEDSVLFLLGPIKPGYDVQAKILECGVEEKVFVHPPVQPHEVMAFANSADLGLQTQQDDGLNHLYCAPIKLFQYLMAGLPVIASDFPGMMEVVRDNEVGLCASPEAPEAIGQAINTILDDDALRRRMSENAQRVARKKYCYEVEGARLLEAAEGLLGRKEA